MTRKEPDEEFSGLTDGIDKSVDNVAEDTVPAVAEESGKKRAPRLSGQVKDMIAQRVATMDYLGFTKREAAKMITDELYPNGEAEFTPKQYVHWLNNIKAAKLMYFDQYSKTGLVLDMIDMNETLKMVYQNSLRQFRMECVKKEKQDKSYIIKLGYLIKDLSEARREIMFSVPFVHSYQHVIQKSRGLVDDIKNNYPSILEVSNTGDTIVRIPHSKSRNAGVGKKAGSESVHEEPEREEAGTTGSEGNVQGDTDDRSVPPANGTTGATAPERIF